MTMVKDPREGAALRPFATPAEVRKAQSDMCECALDGMRADLYRELKWARPLDLLDLNFDLTGAYPLWAYHAGVEALRAVLDRAGWEVLELEVGLSSVDRVPCLRCKLQVLPATAAPAQGPYR